MDKATLVSRQQLVKSSTLGFGLVLVAVLVLMVNYFGWKYHKRFDWTSSRLYSLSEKSHNVLQQLDREIETVVFMAPGSQLYDPVTELLARYEAASPRLSVRVVDPQRNPAEAQSLVEKYEVTALSSVVFDSGDDRRVVEEADLAEYDYSGMQYGQGPQITGFKGEQLFTGAILELLESRKPKILFTTGHGEAEIDDYAERGLQQAGDFLGRDNFAMEAWASLGQPSVPEGADLVVVAGPRARFIQQELDVLSAFLQEGGRVLLLVDPGLSQAGLEDTGLGEWLAGYGVELGEDIVVDPANPLPFFSAETFFAASYANHPVTEALEQANYPVIFSLARSVGKGDSVEGVAVTELVHTTGEGWGETDLANLQAVQKDEDDRLGPVSLGVAVELGGGEEEEETASAEGTGGGEPEGEVGEAEPEPGAPQQAEEGETRSPGRLVVIGDSDFATNAQLASVGNPTLLLNTMNWLVERENLLGIPPKKAEEVRLNLTRSQLSSIYWLVLLILPGLGVLLGGVVYFRRRR